MSRLAIWHTQYQFDLVSRFCHVSLCFVSEVWTCRWDQNPAEFAAVPGVHWPSSGAFRDREVFAGRWLENLRYLPEVSVLQLNSSFFFRFGQWLKKWNNSINSLPQIEQIPKFQIEQLTPSKENEDEWKQKMAKTKTKNFVALVPVSKLKSKAFGKAQIFDSRGFLRWKVLCRVKAWCRAPSWLWGVRWTTGGEKRNCFHWTRTSPVACHGHFRLPTRLVQLESDD